MQHIYVNCKRVDLSMAGHVTLNTSFKVLQMGGGGRGGGSVLKMLPTVVLRKCCGAKLLKGLLNHQTTFYRSYLK